MAVTIFMLMGPFGVLLILFNKWPIIGMLDENNKLVNALKNAKWFQNTWWAGLLLFGMNAILFLSTGFLLFYVVTQTFFQVLVMTFAILGSFFVWSIIHKAWQSTKKSHLKMGGIGSSFYVLLSLVFMYWSWAVEPSSPDGDSFMYVLGLMIGVLIATVAGVSCFIFTGLSKKKVSLTTEQ